MSDLYGTGDVTIYNNDGTKEVAVIQDGSIYRLAVQTKWSLGEFVKSGYVYSVNASVNMASASADNPLILINNPSGSGKVLYLCEFFFNTEVTNVGALFEVYQTPTITANGTAMTITNRNVGGGFGASVANAYTLPTATSNGSEMMRYYIGQNTAGVRVTDFGVAVQPNNAILITGNPASNNRSGTITAVWAEF